ncbi:hypothetical protein N7530_012866 [Penicillium desertorum]|uniref:Secreted protein n=1 Tax=Penicillium desertorum TaxID=1303715 RepID=A0A9W9WDH5_9EURO|nr:hypothetical protein N7530_012866 [Penicillium desertorum]
MTSSPRSALGPPRGHSCPAWLLWGGLVELLPGASAVVTEARGPSAPGTVGVCGSMAAGHTRNSDSRRSRPVVSAVRRRCPRGLDHPRATCRSLPAPSRAPGRIPCVRTGAGGV